ncbi:unnamed protein product [Rotaria sp. Silwood2]|nr:unnamed protein product [Rotaria sp. Silwood2]
MLVANSCLSTALFTILILNIRIFTFENDLRRIEHEDPFCSFREYMGYQDPERCAQNINGSFSFRQKR